MDGDRKQEKACEHMDALNPSKEYLLSFSPFFINHVSVDLISTLVVAKGRSLLYICVGRPHLFVQKILSNRGVNIKNIHFMDMVLFVCRQGNRSNPSKIILSASEGPLEIPTVFKLFRVDQEIDALSLEDVDVMVLDNVSELRTYNTDEQIKTFLELLHSASQKTGKGLILLHLDNRPNDGMKELASSLGIGLKEIPNLAFR